VCQTAARAKPVRPLCGIDKRCLLGLGVPSARTTVKRHPERGEYDRATIDAILDEALICHIGFVVDGQPYVIPTIHARDGDTLYIHGSPASRMLRSIKEGRRRLCYRGGYLGRGVPDWRPRDMPLTCASVRECRLSPCSQNSSRPVQARSER
jgi:Pyridoxamine 5'-phosphate oxidase